MTTRFLTQITTQFNPFSPSAKAARLFLSYVPPSGRSTVKINTKLLPQNSTEPSLLKLTFKDGKELEVDLEKMKLKDVLEEVARRSRLIGKQESLTNS